jgi:hypothetical protein
MRDLLAFALGIVVGTIATMLSLNLRPARVPARWVEPDPYEESIQAWERLLRAEW